jgi:ribosomal RNA small subunit methyltransferase A
MESLLLETRRLLAEYAITPRKSLGQSFVVDPNLLECMIDHAELDPRRTAVIEAGGGLGMLSQELICRCRSLTVVEKDPLLGSILMKRLHGFHPAPCVLVGDFLKISLPRADTFVSNLPFYASTPITFRILSESLECKLLVATYQREYARRMCALPGSHDYGRLSLMLAYFATFEMIKTFPPRSFWPSPKVAVTVVQGRRLSTSVPPEVCTPSFREFIVTLFGRKHRRVRGQLLGYLKHQYGMLSPLQRATLERRSQDVLDLDRRIISLGHLEALALYRTLQEAISTL